MTSFRPFGLTQDSQTGNLFVLGSNSVYGLNYHEKSLKWLDATASYVDDLLDVILLHVQLISNNSELLITSMATSQLLVFDLQNLEWHNQTQSYSKLFDPISLLIHEKTLFVGEENEIAKFEHIE